MDTFLQLNRNKLKFAFAATSLSALGLVAIVLTVAYFKHSLPDIELLINILLVAGIGFPIFIILLASLVWHINRQSRKMVFSKHPFNELEVIGFHKSYLNSHSKWHFTEEIKAGVINGFALLCGISKEKNNTIEFEAPTEWKQLSKMEYKRLSEKFKELNIEFHVGCLVKFYNSKQLTVHTIQELKEDLEYFTETLKSEGFGPSRL